MRVTIPTRSSIGVRHVAGVMGYYYDDYRGPAEQPPRAAMNPVHLGALAVRQYPIGPPALPSNVSVSSGGPTLPSGSPQICPAWGCGAPPIIHAYLPSSSAPPVSTQTTPTPTMNTTGIPRTTAAQSAGSPVPVGYPTNSPYVASNGAQWEFSSTSGTWQNVGTPYNVDSSASAAPASATSPNASTAAEVAGTPVPVGFPITQPYVDSSGNTWVFNSALSSWAVSSLSTAGGSSAVTATGLSTSLSTAAQVAGTPVPVGYSNSAIYTDASGNTWQFNSTSGMWTETALAASASFSDQVAGWLSASTSIGGMSVPNAVLAAGTAIIVAFLWKGKK